jgi:PAS domain S-box-containing protein
MKKFLQRLFGKLSAEPTTAEPTLQMGLPGRQGAEFDLRQSEKQYAQLVAGLKDYAVFMLDPEGRIATWNSGAQIIKGYTAQEIIGQHFSVFYPPEAVEAGWPDEELRLAAEHGRIEDEGWRIRKDGTKFWANVVITALRDADGTLQGFAKVTRDMTERRQAEENARRLIREEAARQVAEAGALEAQQAWDEERRQRERFLVTLASIGDGVIVTDEKAQVTFLNTAAEQLTGWTLADAQGQHLETVFRIINEQTRQPVENPVDKVLRERQVVGLANHTILIAKDGTERFIDDSAAPIRELDGSIVGVVLVFRDVSEQRQFQLARGRLAALVDSSGDAILGLTFDGVITNWNIGAERLFGFTAQEAVGASAFSTIVPPDRKDELLEVLHRVQHGELVDQFETVRQDKAGRPIPVSIRISPIHDGEGNIVGASAIDRDISQQRTAEQRRNARIAVTQILAQEQDVEKALTDILAAICTALEWDVGCFWQHRRDENVLHCLEYWQQPSRPLEDFRNATINVAFEPGHSLPGRVWKSRQPLWIADVVADADFVRAPQAQSTNLHGGFACPVAVGERFLGVIECFSHDIQEPDADLLEMMTTIGAHVGQFIERREAEQQLRDADRRKDEFLAMLAHELRNPLVPIRSGLEILAMDVADHREIIALMQEQVEHIVRLVDDLLDVSRIMRGKVELRQKPTEIAPLVRRSVPAVQPLIDGHHQQLHVSMPEEPIWIDADPVRLIQVIENLLNNASKYTDVGGRIELAVARTDGQVTITVADTGVGIEPELLPNVFDIFTQSSRSLDRAQGGLGIGLTLVQTLVEMHGGTVAAFSEGPGQGSTFTVRLPIVEAPPAAQGADEGRHPTERRRILVVDDNTGAAQLLTMLLRKLDDHEVETAHDGPTALEIIKAVHPEIVLLDIGLPGMDGYQVAQQVRQDHQFDDVLLVALTGYGQEEDRKKSREVGFDQHVVKPPSLDQINEILRHPKLSK